MSSSSPPPRSALVFGARNLGRAVIEALVADGWQVAGAARSQETLDGVTAAGAPGLQADVTDQANARATVQAAADAHGGIDLVVNAASAYGGTRRGPFGGGPLARAGAHAVEPRGPPPAGAAAWAAAPARGAPPSPPGAAPSAAARGRPATLIQVTGGSARRAMPD